MRCAIWYHLYNLKNVENNHGGVLLLVKVFFTFFKLNKWHQIAQRITCDESKKAHNNPYSNRRAFQE